MEAVVEAALTAEPVRSLNRAQVVTCRPSCASSGNLVAGDSTAKGTSEPTLVIYRSWSGGSRASQGRDLRPVHTLGTDQRQSRNRGHESWSSQAMHISRAHAAARWVDGADSPRCCVWPGACADALVERVGCQVRASWPSHRPAVVI